MKSDYNRRNKTDLKDRIIKEELDSFSNYLTQPRPVFYSSPAKKTRSIPEEPPKNQEISGEYFEANSEIRDVAFSCQDTFSKKDLLNNGICTRIIDMHHEQAEYENEEESI